MKRSIFAAIASFIAIISVQSFAMRRQTIKRIGKPVVKNVSRRLFSTSKRKVQVPRTPKEFKQIRSRQYSTKQKEESPWAHLIKNSLETTEKPPKRAWWPWKKKPTLSSSLPKRYGGVPGPSLWQQIKSNKWVRRITGLFGGYGAIKVLFPGKLIDLKQAYDIRQFLYTGKSSIITIANKNENNRTEVGNLLLQNYEKIMSSDVTAEIFEMFLSKVVPKMDAENKENFINNLLSKINKQSNFRLLNNNKFATKIILAMESHLTDEQPKELYTIITKNLESSLKTDKKIPVLIGFLQYEDPMAQPIDPKKGETEKEVKKRKEKEESEKEERINSIFAILSKSDYLENPEVVLSICNLHTKIKTNIKERVNKRTDLSAIEKEIERSKLHEEKEPLSKAIEELNKKAIKNLSSMQTDKFLSWSKPKQKALVNYIKLNFEDEGLTAKQHLFNIIGPERSDVATEFAKNPQILQLIINNIAKNDLLKLRNSFETHVNQISKRKDNQNRISETIFPIIDKKLKEMGVRLN